MLFFEQSQIVDVEKVDFFLLSHTRAMETSQKQNGFFRSKEAPMEFQYDVDNPFHVTTSIFSNTPKPSTPQPTESDVDEPAGIAGQKRTLFSVDPFH